MRGARRRAESVGARRVVWRGTADGGRARGGRGGAGGRTTERRGGGTGAPPAAAAGDGDRIGRAGAAGRLRVEPERQGLRAGSGAAGDGGGQRAGGRGGGRGLRRRTWTGTR